MAFPVFFAAFAVIAGLANAADVTFFFASDLHYGRQHDTTLTRAQWDSLKSSFVDVINNLPGTAYPPVIGGTVGIPRGVVLTGDLIDKGRKSPAVFGPEWASFIADYGVNGEGRCEFPVFEGWGNHDLLSIADSIKVRNTFRENLTGISPNGYHYSWDWDGIHFIQLNIFPGNSYDSAQQQPDAPSHDPMLALNFLNADLAQNAGNTGRPVIALWHDPPMTKYWGERQQNAAYKVLQNYNVILLLNGHSSAPAAWRGIANDNANDLITSGIHVIRIAPSDSIHIVRRISGPEWNLTRITKKAFFRSYASAGIAAVVTNGNLASNITPRGAIVSGQLIYEAPGAAPTSITVYYGLADGGADGAKWEHSLDIGPMAVDSLFTAGLEDLLPDNAYYYRCYAANTGGSAWSAYSVPFSTSVTEDTITVTSPEGGEIWEAEGTYPVTWTSTGTGDGFDSVSIEYVVDSTWRTVTEAAPNNGYYRWKVPATALGQAKIRVLATNGDAADTSNKDFSIVPSTVVRIRYDGKRAQTAVRHSEWKVEIRMGDLPPIVFYGDHAVRKVFMAGVDGRTIASSFVAGRRAVLDITGAGSGVYFLKLDGQVTTDLKRVVIP